MVVDPKQKLCNQHPFLVNVFYRMIRRDAYVLVLRLESLQVAIALRLVEVYSWLRTIESHGMGKRGGS